MLCQHLGGFSSCFLEQKPIQVPRAMDVPRQAAWYLIYLFHVHQVLVCPHCDVHLSGCLISCRFRAGGGPWKDGRGCHSSFLPLLLACTNNGRGLSTTKHRSAKQNFLTGVQGNKIPKSIQAWSSTSISRTSMPALSLERKPKIMDLFQLKKQWHLFWFYKC